MQVIEWVTKTVNRDGKNLRHLKNPKIILFQSFLYLWAFNLVFICPTLCQLKTTCLLLMKQKLYVLDAFFIERLKLSENDPYIYLLPFLTIPNQVNSDLLLLVFFIIQKHYIIVNILIYELNHLFKICSYTLLGFFFIDLFYFIHNFVIFSLQIVSIFIYVIISFLFLCVSINIGSSEINLIPCAVNDIAKRWILNVHCHCIESATATTHQATYIKC